MSHSMRMSSFKFCVCCLLICSIAQSWAVQSRQKRVLHDSVVELLMNRQKAHEKFEESITQSIRKLATDVSRDHNMIEDLLANVTRKLDDIYANVVQTSSDVKEILDSISKLESVLGNDKKLDKMGEEFSDVLQRIANTLLCPAGYRYMRTRHACYVLSSDESSYDSANEKCSVDKATADRITEDDIPFIQSYLKDEANTDKSFMIWAGKKKDAYSEIVSFFFMVLAHKHGSACGRNLSLFVLQISDEIFI